MSVGGDLRYLTAGLIVGRMNSPHPTPRRVMVPNASSLSVKPDSAPNPTGPVASRKTCAECDRPALAKGLCKYHYYKARDAARREEARRVGIPGRASAVTHAPSPSPTAPAAVARPASLDSEVDAHMRRVAAAAGISVAELQRRIISDWYRRSLSAVVPTGE